MQYKIKKKTKKIMDKKTIITAALVSIAVLAIAISYSKSQVKKNKKGLFV